MKTLKVLLKQHTPLIHFQHDQEGATLRASEVKPKLDRFIIENVFNNDYASCKHFLIGYKASNKTIDIEKEKEENSLNKALEMKFKNQNFRALNYKLKIHGAGIDKRVLLKCSVSPKKNDDNKKAKEYVYKTETFPLLLSNMGGKDNKEELVNFSFSKDIKLDFTFWDNNSVISGTDDLLNTIKGQIARFFANTNFGQRSNKGFGSFTVVKINEKNLIWNHNDVLENDIQLMTYEVEQDGIEKIKTLFGVIDFYWKCLKSGVNCTKRKVISRGNVIRNKNERYMKSFLWKFLNDQGYTWEKRIVKNDLRLGSVAAKGDEIVVKKDIPAFFARAHLGCPINGITYRIAKGEKTKDNKGKDVEKKKKVDIDITNNMKIERIASPIIFKPVFNTIMENGITKKVVYIYILYDRHVIEKLSNIPNADFKFTRKDNHVNTKLPLFLKDDQGNNILLDYHKLIKLYHQSMSFKMVPRDFGWNNILGDKEVLFRWIIKQK